jgi:plasmid stability protein
VFLCYCVEVKNLTVTVPEDVYRAARVRAAERGTSVSALVAEYLRSLSAGGDQFSVLAARQRAIQSGIGHFRGAERLGRDDVHDRRRR